jgi:hypothetical protein
MPEKVFNDNQACIANIHHNSFVPHNQHIGLRYHCIRDMVNSQEVDLGHVSTVNMLADGFTKGLDWSSTRRLRGPSGWWSHDHRAGEEFS